MQYVQNHPESFGPCFHQPQCWESGPPLSEAPSIDVGHQISDGTEPWRKRESESKARQELEGGRKDSSIYDFTTSIQR